MKISRNIVLNFIIFIVLAALLVWLLNFSYSHSPFFKSLFGTAENAVIGEAAPDQQTLAGRAESAGRLSFYIYLTILLIQLAAFFIGLTVLGTIKRIATTPLRKLDMLANAEIFMDLPLYIGLFGTVSSFVVLTYSPLSGQLIAYSSTLIGIVFSVIMRVAILYPFRLKLLQAAPENTAIEIE